MSELTGTQAIDFFFSDNELNLLEEEFGLIVMTKTMGFDETASIKFLGWASKVYYREPILRARNKCFINTVHDLYRNLAW